MAVATTRTDLLARELRVRFKTICLISAFCEMPCDASDVCDEDLVEISRAVAKGAHAALMLDGAGWHAAKALEVPVKYHPRAASALCPGTQSNRECLGLSASQPPRHLRLRDRPRDRHAMLRRMELLRQ
jgi:hypothetical protein